MLSCCLKTQEIFKNKRDLHNGSTRFAWAVISISVYSGFPRAFRQSRGIAGHASLCY